MYRLLYTLSIWSVRARTLNHPPTHPHTHTHTHFAPHLALRPEHSSNRLGRTISTLHHSATSFSFIRPLTQRRSASINSLSLNYKLDIAVCFLRVEISFYKLIYRWQTDRTEAFIISWISLDARHNVVYPNKENFVWETNSRHPILLPFFHFRCTDSQVSLFAARSS